MRRDEEQQLRAVVVALLIGVTGVLAAVTLMGVWGTAVFALVVIPGAAYGPELVRRSMVHFVVWRYSRRLRRW